jgi:hypothetical protein
MADLTTKDRCLRYRQKNVTKCQGVSGGAATDYAGIAHSVGLARSLVADAATPAGLT